MKPSTRESVATVHAGSLSNFVAVAREVGLDPRRALREAGIDWRVLDEPERRVSTEKVAACMEAAARESGCQTFGLRMAEARRLSDLGALSLLFAHQPTLRDVMKTTARYGRLLNEAAVWHVNDAGDLAIVHQVLVAEGFKPLRQGVEQGVGVMCRMFGAILGPGWRPYAVGFTHAAPDDASFHRRFFGCDVHFDADFNGLVCRQEDLDRVSPAADPAMAEHAQRYIDAFARPDAEPTPAAVRKAIHLLLPVGRASITQVAGWLGMNERTLQRRLAAEGLVFTDLLNAARRDLARRYLAAGNLSATDISRRLGYEQLGSFTRWFTAAFGCPPSRWSAAIGRQAADAPRN